MSRSYLTKVICLECNRELEFHPGLDYCPKCGGAWFDARYDYETVAKIWQNGLSGRVKSLWRYLELLPLVNSDKMVEGNKRYAYNQPDCNQSIFTDICFDLSFSGLAMLILSTPSLNRALFLSGFTGLSSTKER